MNIPEADRLAIVERFQEEGCPVSVAQSLMRLCCGESAASIAESVDRSAGTIRRWKNEYKEPVSKVREVIALVVLSAPEFYDRSLLTTFVSAMQEQEHIGIEGDNITHSTSSLRDIIRPLLIDDVAFTIEQSIARLDQVA